MITNAAIGIQGRLGNQLFQYAMLFAQARRLGCRAFVNRDMPGYDLDPYCLDASGTVITLPDDEYQKLYTDEIHGQVGEPAFEYAPSVTAGGDHSDYRGYFQSERYFLEVAAEVRNCFRLSQNPFSDTARAWKNRIACDSDPVVALHVRRGDYLDKPQYHTNLHASNYYRRAVARLEVLLGGPLLLVVFSDDIAWCAENLPAHLNRDLHFIDGIDPHAALHLQSLCDHHIIANSAFGWWGAWLARTESQRVIAPAEWFGPSGPCPYNSVYCKAWIVL